MKTKIIDYITDDIVTIVAILGIVYLGVHGVVDPEVVGAIAGLGGYRLHKKSQGKKEE
jgi:hypothetical protein